MSWIAWTETPRGLGIILTVIAVLASGTGYWIGYDLAQNPARPVVIVIQR